MSDYLWNRTGPADADIEQLEQTLTPLAWKPRRTPIPRQPALPYAAIAAALLVGFFAWRLLPHTTAQPTAWRIDGRQSGQVYTGQSVRAPAAASVALEFEEFGRIELQPRSEIRILDSAPGQQRMQLVQGRMHALIWAPPRQFVVDTPSARAVDLGCQYDLSVDARGDGFLRVQTGWVAFQAGRNESFIPSGAACRTTRLRGPGIPYFEDAPPAFRSALERYEQGGGREALARLLETARPEDGLSLWHVLSRAGEQDRGAVFDRFAQLVALPAGAGREKVLRRDPAALDLCWNALGLADAGWWREWKSDWRR